MLHIFFLILYENMIGIISITNKPIIERDSAIQSFSNLPLIIPMQHIINGIDAIVVDIKKSLNLILDSPAYMFIISPGIIKNNLSSNRFSNGSSLSLKSSFFSFLFFDSMSS